MLFRTRCCFAMAIVVFANFRIHERLIVAGNAAETARNIVAHERLFRIGIACGLIYCTGLVILLTALYVILKPVNRGLASLAAFWRLVYALMWVLMTLNLFEARRLLSGADYLRVFEADRLQTLARLYLGACFDQYYVGLLFYALASTVCSYLWFKSNYLPSTLRKKGCRDIDSVQAPRFYDLGKDFGCLAGGSQIVFRAVGYTATSAYVA